MIAWIVETLVATSLLMLLVLLVRGQVRRTFGPQMAYALWLLPVLRLALPPLPESWREQAAAPVAAASDVIVLYIVEPMGAAPAAGAEGSFGLVALLASGWAVGAAVFLLYHLVAHGRFCARLLRRARVDRTVAQGRVRVIETDAAHGPLAFGIWRKYVAFPRDFNERYDETERDLALAHELGHHIRGDLIANWVALFVLAIHWFNPVAWRAFRAFRADQEMACDALVLAGREAALRHAYGRAIVKSAHGGAVSAACHLHTINEVKGRLRMLSKTRQFSSGRIATGVIGVGALSLAALGATAATSEAAAGIRDKVEATIGTLDLQDVPAAPRAPAAPPAPGAPAAPEPPEAPEAPVKRVVKVIVDKDGKREVQTLEGAEAEAAVAKGLAGRDKLRTRALLIENGELDEKMLASLPEIRESKCGTGKPTMIEKKEGKKRVTIICTDRIEALATDAETLAFKQKDIVIRSKEMGLMSAKMGLRHARLAIEAQPDLTPDQKKEALAGIDKAIAELESGSADD